MSDKENNPDLDEDEEEQDEKGQTRGSKLLVPTKFTVDHLIKAIKLVNDKSGKAGPKELQPLFGDNKNLLSRSLSFASKIGLLTRVGVEYQIGDEGRAFLTMNDDERKKKLASKLVTSVSPYRDLLLRLSGENENTLSKQKISEFWSTTAGGGGIAIRKQATLTFSSLANYCGLIEDTGKNCKLTPFGQTIISSTPAQQTGSELVPGGLTVEAPVKERKEQPTEIATIESSAIPACPRCKGKNIGILDESPVQYFRAAQKTIVLIKFSYQCQDCLLPFSRLGMNMIQGVI